MKHCTNCQQKNHSVAECWEQGGGNHANAPDWVKKATNKSGNKDKKNKGTKAHTAKEDSGSELVAMAINTPRPEYMAEPLIGIGMGTGNTAVSPIRC